MVGPERCSIQASDAREPAFERLRVVGVRPEKSAVAPPQRDGKFLPIVAEIQVDRAAPHADPRDVALDHLKRAAIAR